MCIKLRCDRNGCVFNEGGGCSHIPQNWHGGPCQYYNPGKLHDTCAELRKQLTKATDELIAARDEIDRLKTYKRDATGWLPGWWEMNTKDGWIKIKQLDGTTATVEIPKDTFAQDGQPVADETDGGE